MPSVDFSHLKKAKRPATERTRKFTLYTVKAGGPDPVEFELRSAVYASNPALFNARLKAEASNPKLVAGTRRGGEALLPAMIENRELDARLFSQHVFTGWSNVFDASGSVVPFSPDASASLLAMILDPNDRDPGDLAAVYKDFDDLRAFAKDADNWTSDAIDAVEKAKNSEPGSSGSSVASATGSLSTPG